MVLKTLGGVAVLLAVLLDGTVPDMAADTIAKASEVVAPMFFDAFEKNQLPDALTRIGIRQVRLLFSLLRASAGLPDVRSLMCGYSCYNPGWWTRSRRIISRNSSG